MAPKSTRWRNWIKYLKNWACRYSSTEVTIWPRLTNLADAGVLWKLIDLIETEYKASYTHNIYDIWMWTADLQVKFVNSGIISTYAWFRPKISFDGKPSFTTDLGHFEIKVRKFCVFFQNFLKTSSYLTKFWFSYPRLKPRFPASFTEAGQKDRGLTEAKAD